MKISARSVLTAGVATITASAIVIVPSVQPPPRPRAGDSTRGGGAAAGATTGSHNPVGIGCNGS